MNQLSADEAVIFVDAAHPTHAVRPVGCWAPKELPVAVEQSSGRDPPGPAGRILERIYQQMRQHPRPGRSIVDARRRFQTDQTLQPFEPQLNPPSQSIQGQHIVGGDCVDRQRSDDDEATGSLQRFPRGGIDRLASLLAHVPPCGLRDGIWFANSDQAQRQRRTALAADFDCAVEPLACARQDGEQIERFVLLIQPTRIAPAGADHHIAARVQHRRDAVGLQVMRSPIRISPATTLGILTSHCNPIRAACRDGSHGNAPCRAGR